LAIILSQPSLTAVEIFGNPSSIANLYLGFQLVRYCVWNLISTLRFVSLHKKPQATGVACGWLKKRLGLGR